MTAPGGSSGEHEHPAEQPIYDARWAVPGAPPPMPPPYGGYPGGYSPGWEYAAGYATPRSGMNTMAITSLVASILGIFCCVGSIVGVVCGNLALSQIKQTREDGHGLAVGGIVISVVTLLFYLFILGLGVIGA